MQVRKLITIIPGIVLGLIFVALLVVFVVHTRYSAKILPIVETAAGHQATSTAIAVIFGAGLNPDGTPREMLKARIAMGIALLQEGKVGTLYLTGGKQYGHNEPDAMKTYALSHGVLPEQILIDYKGNTTFDSCLNASARFNLAENKNILTILVTQQFHLPRALYLCNNLGLPSIGVAASSTDSAAESSYAKREYVADIKAWLQINLPSIRPLFEK